MEINMSIKSIDSTKTELFKSHGIMFYRNPMITHWLAVDGRLFNPKTNHFMKMSDKGYYTLHYTVGTKHAQPTNVTSIVKALLGIKTVKTTRIYPIVPALGWLEENIGYEEGGIKLGRRPGSTRDSIKKPDVLRKVPQNPVINIPVPEFLAQKSQDFNGFKVSHKVVESKFTTSDGLEFTNKKSADEHQQHILTMKPSSQLIVDNKAGWKLAEEVFLLTMPYKFETRPYSDFKTFLSIEDDKVVEVKDGSIYQFTDNHGLGEFATLVKDRMFTREQMVELTGKMKVINDLSNEILDIIDESMA